MLVRANAPAPRASVNHAEPLIKLLRPPCLLPTRARSPQYVHALICAHNLVVSLKLTLFLQHNTTYFTLF